MIKKSDNRGSTILMVVLVLVGVGIMAAIALWVSLRNVQMKATDEDIKESFYSAEGVLEQVKAGVQEKAELAYKDALVKDLESFSKHNNVKTTKVFAGTDADEKKKDARINEFRKNFKDSFKTKVSATASDDYNISKIDNLVNKSLTDSPSYPYALVTAMKAGYNGDNGLIKDDGDKLVLQGIRVRYVSSEEQVSEILTDITVNIPKPDAVASSSGPDVFEYAIIGDSGVEVNTGNLKVTGNVYAGNKASADKTAFLLAPNVNVELNDKTFISNGKILVGNNSSLKVGSRERLWTENILLNGGSTELEGVSYVADDLTLTGDGSKARISGIYRGYGSAKDVAGNSSAIVVNGKDSELDMTGAKEIILAGYSYIGTSNPKLRATKTADGSAEAAGNTDIKMGESIAVKGNQVAYLMPGEWIGTNSKSESRFNRNPLTYVEYKKLLEDKDASGNKIYTLVNTKVKSKKTGKSLEDYGVNVGNLESNYSKTFVQPITGISSEGLVYFYINFPQEQAAEYFKDYFKADKTKEEELDRHTKFYARSIKSASESNVRTAGNYSIVNPGLAVKQGKSGTGDKSAEYSNEFKALRTGLSSEVEAGQVENEVFNNIMDVSQLNNYLSAINLREVSVKGFKAVITKGDCTYDSSSGDVRLIVALGNVTVKNRFTGSIIAAGKITVESAGEISTDSSGIIRQLLREPLTSGGNDYLYKIFKKGDALASASSTENVNLLFADGSVDVGKLISFSNWKKK